MDSTPNADLASGRRRGGRGGGGGQQGERPQSAAYGGRGSGLRAQDGRPRSARPEGIYDASAAAAAAHAAIGPLSGQHGGHGQQVGGSMQLSQGHPRDQYVGAHAGVPSQPERQHGQGHGRGRGGRGGQARDGSARHSQAAPHAPAPAAQAPETKDSHYEQVVALQHQSTTRFADLPVSPLTKRAMAEVFRYELCTHVQAQALPACLAGGDVLAKAKTGTGKTIGFMIPLIETLLSNPQPKGQLGALVLSPTRELATQIHQETKKLLTFHRLTLQVVIGGTNINSEISRMRSGAPDILVATPGRCLDHMTHEGSNLQTVAGNMRVLVCDEADNLLDMGFRPTIEKILRFLPPKGKRQALLFSATFPQDVQDLARFALQAPWKVVDTVGTETQTNVQVDQTQVVVPFEDQFYYLFAALTAHIRAEPNDYKVIVFFPTARQTQVYAEVFQAAGMDVLEIHSRKSQTHRTRVSDEFRRRLRCVMFSSDVSARGVDYPDVSLVVQVGVPTDKAQYVHRVGRTARAGKAGHALLVLCDFEAGFLRQLSDLPLTPAPQLAMELRGEAVEAVTRGLGRVSLDTKGKAYAAWLGFYNSCPSVKMGTDKLVELANHFSTVMGCSEPPELEAKTVGKMGLKGVPGLRIAGKGANPGRGGGGGGGRGGRGAGGGGGPAGGPRMGSNQFEDYPLHPQPQQHYQGGGGRGGGGRGGGGRGGGGRGRGAGRG